MKRFRFKLQTVLELRTQQLEQVQQKIAVEEQKRMSFVQQINSLTQTINHAFDEQNAQYEANPIVDIHASARFSQYIHRLKTQRLLQYRLLQQQEHQMLSIRQELQYYLIKKKSLEKLKEKHHKQFLKMVEHEEEKFLSEIALNMANRK